MSGYLRRLASRVLGQAVPIHSTAALPFGEPPARVEPDTAVEEWPAGAVATRPRSRRAARRASLATPDVDTAVTAAPQVAAARTHRVEDTRQRPQTMPAAPIVQAREVSESPGTEHVRVPLVAYQPRSEERRPDILPRPAGDREVSARIAAAPPGRSPARALERAELASRRPPDAPASEPDVHVHIGRIEVTAVTRPETPPRVPRTAAGHIPLSEYLQGRHRRRR